MFYRIYGELKWIDVDNTCSRLIVATPIGCKTLVELKFSISIPTKCHWGGKNFITNRDIGYHYFDDLNEIEQVKKVVVDDLIKTYQECIDNSKFMIERFEKFKVDNSK